jgi:selenide,water dikinase
VPGGSKRNWKYVEAVTEVDADVDAVVRTLLADAQTSGGLLLALPEAMAEIAVRRLHDEGVAHASVIGRLEAADVATDGGPRLRVVA